MAASEKELVIDIMGESRKYEKAVNEAKAVTEDFAEFSMKQTERMDKFENESRGKTTKEIKKQRKDAEKSLIEQYKKSIGLAKGNIKEIAKLEKSHAKNMESIKKTSEKRITQYKIKEGTATAKEIEKLDKISAEKYKDANIKAVKQAEDQISKLTGRSKRKLSKQVLNNLKTRYNNEIKLAKGNKKQLLAIEKQYQGDVTRIKGKAQKAKGEGLGARMGAKIQEKVPTAGPLSGLGKAGPIGAGIAVALTAVVGLGAAMIAGAKKSAEFTKSLRGVKQAAQESGQDFKAIKADIMAITKPSDMSRIAVAELSTTVAKFEKPEKIAETTQALIDMQRMEPAVDMDKLSAGVGRFTKALGDSKSAMELITQTAISLKGKAADPLDEAMTELGTVFSKATIVIKDGGRAAKESAALFTALTESGYEISEATTAAEEVFLKLNDAVNDPKIMSAITDQLPKGFDLMKAGLDKNNISATKFIKWMETAGEVGNKVAFALGSTAGENLQILQQNFLKSGTSISKFASDFENTSGVIERMAAELTPPIQQAQEQWDSAWENMTLNLAEASQETGTSLLQMGAGIAKWISDFAMSNEQLGIESMRSSEHFENLALSFQKIVEQKEVPDFIKMVSENMSGIEESAPLAAQQIATLTDELKSLDAASPEAIAKMEKIKSLLGEPIKNAFSMSFKETSEAFKQFKIAASENIDTLRELFVTMEGQQAGSVKLGTMTNLSRLQELEEIANKENVGIERRLEAQKQIINYQSERVRMTKEVLDSENRMIETIQKEAEIAKELNIDYDEQTAIQLRLSELNENNQNNLLDGAIQLLEAREFQLGIEQEINDITIDGITTKAEAEAQLLDAAKQNILYAQEQVELLQAQKDEKGELNAAEQIQLDFMLETVGINQNRLDLLYEQNSAKEQANEIISVIIDNEKLSNDQKIKALENLATENKVRAGTLKTQIALLETIINGEVAEAKALDIVRKIQNEINKAKGVQAAGQEVNIIQAKDLAKSLRAQLSVIKESNKQIDAQIAKLSKRKKAAKPKRVPRRKPTARKPRAAAAKRITDKESIKAAKDMKRDRERREKEEAAAHKKKLKAIEDRTKKEEGVKTKEHKQRLDDVNKAKQLADKREKAEKQVRNNLLKFAKTLKDNVSKALHSLMNNLGSLVDEYLPDYIKSKLASTRVIEEYNDRISALSKGSEEDKKALSVARISKEDLVTELKRLNKDLQGIQFSKAGAERGKDILEAKKTGFTLVPETTLEEITIPQKFIPEHLKKDLENEIKNANKLLKLQQKAAISYISPTVLKFYKNEFGVASGQELAKQWGISLKELKQAVVRDLKERIKDIPKKYEETKDVGTGRYKDVPTGKTKEVPTGLTGVETADLKTLEADLDRFKESIKSVKDDIKTKGTEIDTIGTEISRLEGEVELTEQAIELTKKQAPMARLVSLITSLKTVIQKRKEIAGLEKQIAETESIDEQLKLIIEAEKKKEALYNFMKKIGKDELELVKAINITKKEVNKQVEEGIYTLSAKEEAYVKAVPAMVNVSKKLEQSTDDLTDSYTKYGQVGKDINKVIKELLITEEEMTAEYEKQIKIWVKAEKITSEEGGKLIEDFKESMKIDDITNLINRLKDFDDTKELAYEDLKDKIRESYLADKRLIMATVKDEKKREELLKILRKKRVKDTEAAKKTYVEGLKGELGDIPSNIFDTLKDLPKAIQNFKDLKDEVGKVEAFKSFAGVLENVVSQLDGMIGFTEEVIDGVQNISSAIKAGAPGQAIEAAGDLSMKIGKALLDAPYPLNVAGAVLLAGGLIAKGIGKIMSIFQEAEVDPLKIAELRSEQQQLIFDLYENQIEALEQLERLEDRSADQAKEKLEILTEQRDVVLDRLDKETELQENLARQEEIRNKLAGGLAELTVDQADTLTMEFDSLVRQAKTYQGMIDLRNELIGLSDRDLALRKLALENEIAMFKSTAAQMDLIAEGAGDVLRAQVIGMEDELAGIDFELQFREAQIQFALDELEARISAREFKIEMALDIGDPKTAKKEMNRIVADVTKTAEEALGSIGLDVDLTGKSMEEIQEIFLGLDFSQIEGTNIQTAMERLLDFLSQQIDLNDTVIDGLNEEFDKRKSLLDLRLAAREITQKEYNTEMLQSLNDQLLALEGIVGAEEQVLEIKAQIIAIERSADDIRLRYLDHQRKELEHRKAIGEITQEEYDLALLTLLESRKKTAQEIHDELIAENATTNEILTAKEALWDIDLEIWNLANKTNELDNEKLEKAKELARVRNQMLLDAKSGGAVLDPAALATINEQIIDALREAGASDAQIARQRETFEATESYQQGTIGERTGGGLTLLHDEEAVLNQGATSFMDKNYPGLIDSLNRSSGEGSLAEAASRLQFAETKLETTKQMMIDKSTHINIDMGGFVMHTTATDGKQLYFEFEKRLQAAFRSKGIQFTNL